MEMAKAAAHDAAGTTLAALDQPLSHGEPEGGAASGFTLPQPAEPRLPPMVGWLMLLAYAVTMAGFLLFFGGSAFTVFMLAIGFFYLAVYAGVPLVFLRMQRPRASSDLRQADMAHFFARGLETWTGHLSGRQALFQIMAVPLALAIAVFGIGLAAHFAH
jgi:amino acid transporter